MKRYTERRLYGNKIMWIGMTIFMCTTHLLPDKYSMVGWIGAWLMVLGLAMDLVDR